MFRHCLFAHDVHNVEIHNLIHVRDITIFMVFQTLNIIVYGT